MRDRAERNDIFDRAARDHIDIRCLQETHITEKDHNTLKLDWNVRYIIAGSQTNAGGVLIAINKSFEYILHNQWTDEEGRFIIIDIEIPDVVRFLLINLYAPNEDNPNFFTSLFDKIQESDIKNIIMSGDWNLVNDFEKDTINYKKLNNPKAREIVKSNKDKLDLIDIWRHANPTKSQFTWKQTLYKKMARLDYFLISETLLDIYEDSTIKYSYKSDNSPVNLKLNISKHKRGPGVWKLNNSLLLDKTFQKIVKTEIELVISTYVCTPYNPKFVQENLNDYNFEYMIDIELLWEVLNAQIRGRIMAFASNKKRKTNLAENKLIKEIIRLEKELHQNLKNENWINNLKEKKDK